MLNSYHAQLMPLVLPAPQNRQHYMHSFDLTKPSVPEGFSDYLPVVQKLAYSARMMAFKGQAHLTIDEKIVQAGMSQRRPGPHVDGCFVPAAQSWGHGGSGGWLHGCNNIPTEKLKRMSVIVAASVAGCKVYPGKFIGEPKSDGDLSHISDQFKASYILPANCAYLLSADCVHESLVFEQDTPRTFIRLALTNNSLD